MTDAEQQGDGRVVHNADHLKAELLGGVSGFGLEKLVCCCHNLNGTQTEDIDYASCEVTQYIYSPLSDPLHTAVGSAASA